MIPHSPLLLLLLPPHHVHVVIGPLPPNCEFVINLAPELIEIILETKYLEKLGFHVPDSARNITLQEDKFVLCWERLSRILKRYHQVLRSLNPPEVRLWCCQSAPMQNRVLLVSFPLTD